jgi:hypothetical protein
VALIWKFRIFAETNTGLILIVHLLLGLVLASWSFFVSVPFGKSPHLAAVASTFLGLVFAVLALVIKSSQTGFLFIFSILFPPSFYIFAIKAICGYENHQFPTNALKGDPDMCIVLLPLLIAAIVSQFFYDDFLSARFKTLPRSMSSCGLTSQFSGKDTCIMLVCRRRGHGHFGRSEERVRKYPSYLMIRLFRFAA